MSRMRSPVTSFELSEGEQHVEGQSSHAGRRIEGLGDGNERDAVGVEELDQLGEVGQRSGQAVDLVDDDDIETTLPDRLQKPLESRAAEAGAGEAAIADLPLEPHHRHIARIGDFHRCAGLGRPVEVLPVAAPARSPWRHLTGSPTGAEMTQALE